MPTFLKTSLIATFFCAWYSAPVNCSDHTLLLYHINSQRTLVSEGAPDEPISPCSTFKIPLSLMGFHSGLLESENAPLLECKPEHEKSATLETHKQAQTPTTWMKYSCVWYSQELTKKLGAEAFQTYVDLLNYGNKDLSGDRGQNNGLTQSWLSSSLKITPQEQLSFITKLAKQEVKGFSQKSQQLTRKLICLGPIGQVWTLYGKTGTGHHHNADGSKDLGLWRGWFIGWVENGDNKYAFVYQINNVKRSEGAGGIVAKAALIERLKVELKI